MSATSDWIHIAFRKYTPRLHSPTAPGAPPGRGPAGRAEPKHVIWYNRSSFLHTYTYVHTRDVFFRQLLLARWSWQARPKSHFGCRVVRNYMCSMVQKGKSILKVYVTPLITLIFPIFYCDSLNVYTQGPRVWEQPSLNRFHESHYRTSMYHRLISAGKRMLEVSSIAMYLWWIVIGRLFGLQTVAGPGAYLCAMCTVRTFSTTMSNAVLCIECDSMISAYSDIIPYRIRYNIYDLCKE